MNEEPQIHRRNLELFLSLAPADHPELSAVIQQALEDKDVEIRFIGLQQAGEQADLKYLTRIWEQASYQLQLIFYRYLSRSQRYIPLLTTIFPETQLEPQLVILESLGNIANPLVMIS